MTETFRRGRRRPRGSTASPGSACTTACGKRRSSTAAGLAVRERILGPDHPDVANGLLVPAGVVERERLDDPEVEALTRRAADICEAVIRRPGAPPRFFAPGVPESPARTGSGN